MSNLALHNHIQPLAEPRVLAQRTQLKLVSGLLYPQPAPATGRIVLRYALGSAAAAIAVILLTWLSPPGAYRIPAFAALAAAASLFLLAGAPLAKNTWQRATGVLLAVTQFCLALTAQVEPQAVSLSLLTLCGGSLFMLYASREHDWKAPGVFWFSCILGAGLCLVTIGL